jgi:hypothetical protein
LIHFEKQREGERKNTLERGERYSMAERSWETVAMARERNRVRGGPFHVDE